MWFESGYLVDDTRCLDVLENFKQINTTLVK